jgi:hypothetical protein
VSTARTDQPRWLTPRRALQWTLGLWLVVVLLIALAALPLTVFPASVAVPRDADAVVVLARGGGEQLDAALGLMDRVVGPPADLLLISSGERVTWPEGEDLCGVVTEEYEISCFAPEPDTAAEEARVIGEVARDRSWDNIAIVTTTPQATRSRRLVERCVGDGFDVQVVAAAPEGSLAERVQGAVQGLGDLVRDTLGDEGC